MFLSQYNMLFFWLFISHHVVFFSYRLISLRLRNRHIGGWDPKPYQKPDSLLLLYVIASSLKSGYSGPRSQTLPQQREPKQIVLKTRSNTKVKTTHAVSSSKNNVITNQLWRALLDHYLPQVLLRRPIQEKAITRVLMFLRPSLLPTNYNIAIMVRKKNNLLLHLFF